MEAERAAAAAAEEENARLREQLEMHGANEDVLKEKTELVRAEFENKLKRAQIEVERMTIDKEHAERDLEDARAVAQKLRASLLAREGADRGGSSGAAGGGASAGAGGQATPHTLPLPPLPPSPRTPRTPRSPTGSAGVAVAEARERSNTPLGETGDGDEFVSSPLHADGAAMNTSSDDSTFAGASRGASAPNTSSPKMLQTPPRSDSHASDKAEEGEARCVEQDGVAYRCALLQVSPFEGQRDKAFDMELQEHNDGSVVLLTRWGFVGQPERNCQAHPCASVAAGVQKFCAKFRAKTKNDWQGGAGVAGGAGGAAAFVKHPGMYELAAHRGVGAAAEERPQAPQAQASPPQDGWEDEDEDEDEDAVVEAGAAADAAADAEAAQSRVVSPHVPTHPAPPSAAEYDGALAALERQVGEQRLMIEALEGELAQAQEAMKNVLEEQIRREEEAEQNQGASFVLTELQATVEVLEDELQRSRASEHEATQQCAQLRTVASGAESAAQAAASHARRASAEDEARSAAARSRLEAVIAELEARVSEEQRHRRRAEGDVRTLHNALAAEGVRLPQGVAGAPAANGGGGGKGELKTRADEERNFVLKTRADLVSAVWAAHGDVCRIAKAANVRGGGGAAGNAPSLKELRLSVRAIVSSFFSPLEKLHHGAAASQFRTDERIAAQFPGLFAAAAPTAQAAGNGGRLRRASASPTPGLARKPSGVAGRAQAQQQQQAAAAAAAAAGESCDVVEPAVVLSPAPPVGPTRVLFERRDVSPRAERGVDPTVLLDKLSIKADIAQLENKLARITECRLAAATAAAAAAAAVPPPPPPPPQTRSRSAGTAGSKAGTPRVAPARPPPDTPTIPTLLDAGSEVKAGRVAGGGPAAAAAAARHVQRQTRHVSPSAPAGGGGRAALPIRPLATHASAWGQQQQQGGGAGDARTPRGSVGSGRLRGGSRGPSAASLLSPSPLHPR